MPRSKSKKEIEVILLPTLSGHWYSVGGKIFPSVTEILAVAYPQSPHLMKWIGEQGWHESQRIKSEAGEKGTHVHDAILSLLQGFPVNQESYSLEEWWKIYTFTLWFKTSQKKIIATETIVYSLKHKYAGRIDCIYEDEKGIAVVDFKTSTSIYDHYSLQVSAYANAWNELKTQKITRTEILLLGAKNKNGYRISEDKKWSDTFKSFLNVRKTFDYIYGKEELPLIINIPANLKLYEHGESA